MKYNHKYHETYTIFIPTDIHYYGLWCEIPEDVYTQDIQEFANPHNRIGHVFKMEIRAHGLYNILHIFTNLDWYTTDIHISFQEMVGDATISMVLSYESASIQYQLSKRELEIFKTIIRDRQKQD